MAGTVFQQSETRSLEPLSAHRAGDGWWVLSIEGGLHCMTEDVEIESGNADLGDFLVGLAADTMATVKRNGLVRIWKSADLIQLKG